MITTVTLTDGRRAACWNGPGLHVIGFTTSTSSQPRFDELHCKAGPAPNHYLLTRLVEAWHPPVHVDTGVPTYQVRAVPVADMLTALADPTQPRLRTPDVAAWHGREREAGFRSSRDFRAHVEQACLAEYYAALVVAGERNPLLRIATEQYQGRKSLAANRLAQARANGYLTSTGPGIAGGTVTENALALLGRVDAPTEA